MKNGGSLSTKEALVSRTSLLDFSNHFSALLLSPELSLPASGIRLDGEFVKLDLAPGSLEGALRGLEGECRRDTDRSAAGRRWLSALDDGGEVFTIFGFCSRDVISGSVVAVMLLLFTHVCFQNHVSIG
jgi:hypothetical protein